MSDPVADRMALAAQGGDSESSGDPVEERMRLASTHGTSTAPSRPKTGSDPVLSGKQPELLPMLWEGGKEFAQGLLHGAGTVADVVTGTSPGAGSHAEHWASMLNTDPTLGGQINGQPAIGPEVLSNAYDKSFGTGPLAQTLKERIPQATEAISMVAPVIKGAGGLSRKLSTKLSPQAPIDTQAAMDAAAANSPQSMGASAAALRVNNLSPPMQQAFRNAVQKTGGAVHPEAALNHAEADLHGVQLMEGQAARDPELFSNEQNSTNKAIVKRIHDQNLQMTDAIDNIRREASPGAVQNNPIENGQITVDSLKAYDEPVQADIRAKYKTLIDANGGAVPIDTGNFLKDVDAELKKKYLTKSVPPAASELLESLRSGEPLDFESFEAARTRLAEAQREGGSAGEAAKIIRNRLEQMPLSDQAAALKGLANEARSAAKARFDALEADPAYQAAVDEVSSGVKRGQPSPLADRFLDKYTLGTAPKANVDTMMGKLDPEAQQAVAAHTLSTIRKSAITPNGSVTPHGYNSALQKYGPKLPSLVTPETRESLDSLGRVITNAKVPPPGHFVNSSKSGVIVNAAKGVGEAAVNAKTLGLGMPVIKQISESRSVKKSLAPGAGLTRLPEAPKP